MKLLKVAPRDHAGVGVHVLAEVGVSCSVFQPSEVTVVLQRPFQNIEGFVAPLLYPTHGNCLTELNLRCIDECGILSIKDAVYDAHKFFVLLPYQGAVLPMKLGAVLPMWL